MTPQAQPQMPTGNPAGGALTEVFNLNEGPVTVTFPATLSGDSYQDLADHLAIFLRKAKRRAEAEEYRRRIDGDDIPD